MTCREANISILVAIGETPDVPSQFGLKMGKGNKTQVDKTHILTTSRQVMKNYRHLSTELLSASEPSWRE
jgi:hypothetical protein